MSNDTELNFTYEERQHLTIRVLSVMRDWKLSETEQMVLLGLAHEKPRMLTKLRNGTPLPDDQDILQRVRHLVGIGDALERNYPRTQGGGQVWLRHTNKYLNKRTPIAMMLEDGIYGMHQVWIRLDCTQGWD